MEYSTIGTKQREGSDKGGGEERKKVHFRKYKIEGYIPTLQKTQKSFNLDYETRKANLAIPFLLNVEKNSFHY